MVALNANTTDRLTWRFSTVVLVFSKLGFQDVLAGEKSHAASLSSSLYRDKHQSLHNRFESGLLSV